MLLNEWNFISVQDWCPGAVITNKFQWSIISQCWKEALRLDVASHVTSFNQLKCIILAYWCYAKIYLFMTSTPVVAHVITAFEERLILLVHGATLYLLYLLNHFPGDSVLPTTNLVASNCDLLSFVGGCGCCGGKKVFNFWFENIFHVDMMQRKTIGGWLKIRKSWRRNNSREIEREIDREK